MVNGVEQIKSTFCSSASDSKTNNGIVGSHNNSHCLSRGIVTDTNLAREYELEIDTQYLPLDIYTLEADYTDVNVQVNGQGVRGRRRQNVCRFLSVEYNY